MTALVRVLVADDHPLYREALAALFQRHEEFVLIGAVASLAAAVELVRDDGCDLAILDVHMPGMDGLADVAGFHARCPTAKIALISGDIDPKTVAAGMNAGVTGFLPKSFDHDVLLAAVRLVLAGGVYVPHDLRGASVARAEPRPAQEESPLTPRERAMLAQMAAGATHKEIARSLGIAEVTVKLHTQRIVRKLGVKNRSAAIAKAVQDGLIDRTG